MLDPTLLALRPEPTNILLLPMIITHPTAVHRILEEIGYSDVKSVELCPDADGILWLVTFEDNYLMYLTTTPLTLFFDREGMEDAILMKYVLQHRIGEK